MRNRKKLILTIICLVLLVIAIFEIRQKLLFEKVKREFLSNIYEIQRNGNYHITYHYTDSVVESNYELFAKDGQIYSYSDSSDGSKMIHIVDYDKAYTIFDNGEGKKYLEMPYPQDKMGKKLDGYHILYYDEIENKNRVESIKKGEYKGQECYIVKIVSDVFLEEVQIAYINPETYMPIAIEDIVIENEDNLKESRDLYEYQDISIGSVEKLPEIDLTEYEKIEFPEL
ncbi:MAG: hypothetical protein IJ629_03595 [Clostridia bacterium]|nr:hypothetical protein [Clostridia bacterium]